MGGGCDTSAGDGLRWECGRGLSAIEALANAWNGLSRASPLPPWSDATWMRCYWEAFGSADRDLVVHALFEGRTLVAVLPLVWRPGLLPTWRHAGNSHTSYWVIAAEAARLASVAGEALDHLLGRASVLDVRPVHSRGLIAGAFLTGARRRGLHAAIDDYTGDVLTEIPTSWEACRASLSKNVRSDTGRKLRRLQSAGRLEFDTVEGGDRLDSVLAECFELETLGWKAQRGSPISSTPETLKFYTDLAHALARERRLAIYTLRLDSRLIAFEYCMRGQGTIEMLKLSFDPALSSHSPGNVLRYYLLEKEAEQGEIQTYHLGRPADASGWKLRWASRVDPMGRLRIFGRGVRPSLAYRCGPALRETLKRNPLLLHSVRWVRRLAARRRGGMAG
jgi:CelD/BcsL family acetyltransferase involved in cellulose biosynthesis